MHSLNMLMWHLQPPSIRLQEFQRWPTLCVPLALISGTGYQSYLNVEGMVKCPRDMSHLTISVQRHRNVRAGSSRCLIDTNVFEHTKSVALLEGRLVLYTTADSNDIFKEQVFNFGSMEHIWRKSQLRNEDANCYSKRTSQTAHLRLERSPYSDLVRTLGICTREFKKW